MSVEKVSFSGLNNTMKYGMKHYKTGFLKSLIRANSPHDAFDKEIKKANSPIGYKIKKFFQTTANKVASLF